MQAVAATTGLGKEDRIKDQAPADAAAVPLALPAVSAASLEVRVVRPDMDAHARFRLHARGLSQLYRRGMPLGGSASAGDGNENAAKREGRTPPALPREPHMEADSAACVDP